MTRLLGAVLGLTLAAAPAAAAAEQYGVKGMVVSVQIAEKRFTASIDDRRVAGPR